jgi:hypothetical protein
MTASPATEDEATPDPLQVPSNIVDALLAETVLFGRRNLETGGFFVADTDGIVRALALAGKHGVTRGLGRFAVSGAVLENICEWAADRGLFVAALVHTHKRNAKMSIIDRESGFRVEGFCSVIVPSFADPPSRLQEWGWCEFAGERWVPYTPGVAVANERGDIVTVDESGVR